jgi:hypothetical protein
MSACQVCSKDDGPLFACIVCREAIYCSKQHADQDWRDHKSLCMSIGRDIPAWTNPVDNEVAPSVAAWRTVKDVDAAAWARFHRNTLNDEALSSAVDFVWNNNTGVAFYYIRFGSTPGQLVLVVNKVNMIRLIVENRTVYVTDNAGTSRQHGIRGVNTLSSTVANVTEEFKQAGKAKFGHLVQLVELSTIVRM